MDVEAKGGRTWPQEIQAERGGTKGFKALSQP